MPPSPSTLADQGLKALNDREYPKAIDFYTQALALCPSSPDYYLKRSTAYQRSGQIELALHDADLAVLLAHKRGKRELIGAAQLRRGICLYLDKRYGDADLCFAAAETKCPQNDRKLLEMWRSKLKLALQQVPEDDLAREVTIVEVPDVVVPEPEKQVNVTKLPVGVQKEEKEEAKPPPSVAPEGVVTPPSKIRHEWYQTATHVVLTLFVKGVPKNKATVEIHDRSVAISFPLPSGSDFTFDLEPLYYPIAPVNSSFSILSTKIEVKLEKATPGQKWADLEGASASSDTTTAGIAPASPPPKPAQPTYPTSAKSGPKDWDRVAKELTNSKGDSGAADEKEFDSDYEGGDDVNYFFKKIYKDADPDMKRAMMKSYIESNGTALSTNWKEVGKGKVETSPPDGTVAKKWNE